MKFTLFACILIILTGCTMSPQTQCGIIKVAAYSGMNIVLNNAVEKDIKSEEDMEKFKDHANSIQNILKDTIIPKLNGEQYELISYGEVQEMVSLLDSKMSFHEKLALQSAINVALEAAPIPEENKENKDKGLGDFLIRSIRCMFEGILKAFKNEIYYNKERSLEKEFKCELCIKPTN